MRRRNDELSRRLGVDVWEDADCPPGTAYIHPLDPVVLALFWQNDQPTEEEPG